MTISSRSALAGTLAGAFSHLLLDALVHSDIRPLWPFPDLDPLRGLMSWEAVEHASRSRLPRCAELRRDGAA